MTQTHAMPNWELVNRASGRVVTCNRSLSTLHKQVELYALVYEILNIPFEPDYRIVRPNTVGEVGGHF